MATAQHVLHQFLSDVTLTQSPLAVQNPQTELSVSGAVLQARHRTLSVHRFNGLALCLQVRLLMLRTEKHCSHRYEALCSVWAMAPYGTIESLRQGAATTISDLWTSAHANHHGTFHIVMDSSIIYRSKATPLDCYLAWIETYMFMLQRYEPGIPAHLCSTAACFQPYFCLA